METKEKLIIEGKTKKIWDVPENPDMVRIENKDNITAFNDPKKTKSFATKAEYATNTTCRVFELLKAAGIPVAYEKQISPTEFLALKCTMIPLEVVARRDAVGSYLKRNPNLQVKNGIPFRFHNLKIEFFLKTTEGKLEGIGGNLLVSGLSTEEDDPFIINPKDKDWNLYHPKKPQWDPAANLDRVVSAGSVLGENATDKINEIMDITNATFLVLESAWAQQNIHLVDFKLEFGITPDGRIRVSDVIDNDSWRVHDYDRKDLSKESFRQGEELSEVERKYGIVSRMVNNFRLPKQCLVIWVGSGKDEIPKIDERILPFVDVLTEIKSGHKSPEASINRLEEILSLYPDGGVVIEKAGRSNGLGPVLAARTSWSVIAVPATIEKFPEDIWSSIRMPSDVPLMIMWPEENAVLGALNILAQKNPAIYRFRQQRIETLDL